MYIMSIKSTRRVRSFVDRGKSQTRSLKSVWVQGIEHEKQNAQGRQVRPKSAGVHSGRLPRRSERVHAVGPAGRSPFFFLFTSRNVSFKEASFPSTLAKPTSTNLEADNNISGTILFQVEDSWSELLGVCGSDCDDNSHNSAEGLGSSADEDERATQDEGTVRQLSSVPDPGAQALRWSAANFKRRTHSYTHLHSSALSCIFTAAYVVLLCCLMSVSVPILHDAWVSNWALGSCTYTLHIHSPGALPPEWAHMGHTLVLYCICMGS